MNCVVCGTKAENHHIRSRGAGGTDDDWNLMPLCRREHTTIHQIGTVRFVEKYRLGDLMSQKGWVLTERFGKRKFERE